MFEGGERDIAFDGALTAYADFCQAIAVAGGELYVCCALVLQAS